ncbi:MAG: crossover junction endodeoxyribonuclease RuvC [Bacteroidota bacterium]|nr:crossover junction endodeoxyribonuclease RuvC [Bacteroidota bacterium]MDE2835736.1 crossover junction endodeoxyribonuclease RuvC [Bacteroidota bacterium]MDE2955408.1 crossover junction endodeoxyribonuclease RuvC [Bacteroidota bacterium]
MMILGIDPGSLRTGYGIIDSEHRVHGFGVVAVSGDHVVRIQAIYRAVTELVTVHKPDACAVEMPVYGQNPQAMLKLGRAQAAAMLAAFNQGLAVTQYTPKMIKRAVTGNGNASKQQVEYMIRSLLRFGKLGPDLTHDASDALATALCHCHRETEGRTGTKVHKGWASFIRANPDRIASP